MPFLHKELAEGGWSRLSLSEQMGNIGSEVSRAALWQGKDAASFQAAVLRALELFDLTVRDPRWGARLKEICRSREVFCDAAMGEQEYGSLLADLEPYFDDFAIAARAQK